MVSPSWNWNFEKSLLIEPLHPRINLYAKIELLTLSGLSRIVINQCVSHLRILYISLEKFLYRVAHRKRSARHNGQGNFFSENSKTRQFCLWGGQLLPQKWLQNLQPSKRGCHPPTFFKWEGGSSGAAMKRALYSLYFPASFLKIGKRKYERLKFEKFI